MFALKHPLSFLSCLLIFQAFCFPTQGDQSFDCNLLADTKQEINITLPDNFSSASFNFVDIKPDTDGLCKWRILSSFVDSSLKLDLLTLDPNDKLTVKGLIIKDNVTTESTIFVGNDLPNAGFLDIKTFNQVLIELNLSKNKPKVKRSFSAQFNSHEVIVLNQPEDVLTVQLNQKNTSSNAKLVFTSPFSRKDQFVFILDFINLPDKYNIQINDVTFTNSKPIPSFLLLSDSKFTLNVNNFIPSSNPIAFRYWSVTKACSGNVDLAKDYKDKDFVIPTVTEEVRKSLKLTMARCVQVLRGDSKQQIIVNIPNNLTSLMHPQDSLTFYNANKSIELSLNKASLAYFRNADTFLTNDKYLVIYKIPFFSDNINKDFVAPSLRLSSNSGYWMINNDQKVSKTIGDGKTKYDDTHLLYSSMLSQPGSKDAQEIQLEFVTRQVTPGDWSISIYTSEYKNSKPIIELGKYDMLPTVISSPNGVMRVTFKGVIPKIDLIYKSVDKEKSCSFVGGDSPFSKKAFNINGGQSNDVCSWIIPENVPQDINSSHFTILSPVYVKIPENATLSFTQFLPKGSSVQQFKGPIEKSFMPDLFLSSNYSYELSIMPHDFEPNKLHLLVEQRNDYSNSSIVIDEFSSQIRSINYPGSYPIGYDQLYFASGQGQVFMTVEDISVLKNHSLAYLANSGTKEIPIPNDIEQIHDEILSLPIFFYFHTSVFNVEHLFKEDHEYVRGFDIKLLHVGNASNVEVKNSTTFNFSSGNAAFTYPIAVWSLKYDDKSVNISDHIFKINITYNHDPKDTKSKIMLYDSKSIRDKSKHEALLNVNSTTLEKQYMTSTRMAYIIYNYTDSIQTKLDYGIKVEVIVEKCHNSRNYSLTKCEKFDRCITDLMICNGQDDCGDWSDEKYCNGSIQPNPPVPQAGGGGVSLLVVIFLLMPISAILGIFGYVYLPNILMRLRHGRYSEFRDLSSVS